ncbi:acyltransferase family protein [Gloeobacter kilaueensis]|uniref:Glucans biosynthesis protein n=1 Tax=Gloeobacter kilaueensis (strain ATCC BAA-2537 / CCAP 1431/1 / ULC 316 / JS1) TaxID=1183438 RepID=U5QQG3_GLOK1|nr:acyltransferase family protein [Gloeobacter kilaueensis]AGY59849.1 glucans biosynthesis protein [Gloeobacter kilaueensis JS1]
MAGAVRRYELDWLKVIVTLLVLCFHTARVFDSEDWNIKNDPLLERRAPIEALIKAGKHQEPPLIAPERVRAFLASRPFERTDQEAFARITTSTDQIVRLAGELQTGVVYQYSALAVLRAVRDLAGPAGGRLLALVPSGRHWAQQMERGTGIAAMDLESFLALPQTRLPRHVFLIVDYAAFAGGEQLEALLERVRATDSRALLVGQPVFLGADLLVSFLNQWFMPLFFLIAGSGSWFALGRRSGRQYIVERTGRLFVPFLFGTLVIVPPQAYCQWLTAATEPVAYLQFYPRFLGLTFFRGAPEWGHLWFVIYLFVFSLVALPLFLWLRRPAGQRLLERLGSWCEKPAVILLAGVPVAVVEAALRGRWGFGHYNLIDDWSDVCYYLLFFVYGYLLAADERFGRAIDRLWPLALGLAGILMVGMFSLSYLDLAPDRGYSPAYLTVISLHGLRAWLWLVGILGLARRALNFENPFLRYAGEAAYPFYILHQTVIIVVGFFVVRWSLTAPLKFGAIALASLILTLALYELGVRRLALTRLLFGLKRHRPRLSQAQTASATLK